MMAPIASLLIILVTITLLWVAKVLIEARCDVWVEQWKLGLIDRADIYAITGKGSGSVDIDTGQFWAYNPLRPYKIGFLRDGWHFLKAIGILCVAIAIAIPLTLVVWQFTGLNACWVGPSIAGSIVLIRAVVFPLALKGFRK